jgi:hypothetical protein
MIELLTAEGPIGNPSRYGTHDNLWLVIYATEVPTVMVMVTVSSNIELTGADILPLFDDSKK